MKSIIIDDVTESALTDLIETSGGDDLAKFSGDLARAKGYGESDASTIFDGVTAPADAKTALSAALRALTDALQNLTDDWQALDDDERGAATEIEQSIISIQMMIAQRGCEAHEGGCDTLTDLIDVIING